MANEIQAQTTTGQTLYAVLINSTGSVWNGSAFVTINPANWADYDIALTEATAGIYLGAMPAIGAGTYQFVVYARAGATPATTDSQVDTGTLDWNGSAVVVAAEGAYYGTLARLRAEHLTQVASGATNDALLTQMLVTATALVDNALGFSFADYGSTATARTFWHPAARQYLTLPYHSSGSLASLALADAAIAADAYAVEADDHLQLYNAAGWAAGRYTATAIWGAGPAPEVIVKITLQLAVDLWGARLARSSAETAGLDGPGQAPVQRAFTWQQWQVLQAVRREYGQLGVA